MPRRHSSGVGGIPPRQNDAARHEEQRDRRFWSGQSGAPRVHLPARAERRQLLHHRVRPDPQALGAPRRIYAGRAARAALPHDPARWPHGAASGRLGQRSARSGCTMWTSANPEESPNDVVPVWNKTCYSCHVSREQKNFDPEGPALSHHLAEPRRQIARAAMARESVMSPARAQAIIVNPARLDAARSTMVCAQCHSLRNIYADGFRAGANYYDYFLPVMEYRLPASDDPAYWPDGRPRWFANDAVALWQSQCFLKGGATCITCHSRVAQPMSNAIRSLGRTTMHFVPDATKRSRRTFPRTPIMRRRAPAVPAWSATCRPR